MTSSNDNSVKNIISKIILIVLGLSMIVFWGLGGLTNLTLSRSQSAIEIGSDDVSVQQVAMAFDKERERMGMMMGGKYLSPAQGIQAGLLDAAVQGQIIAGVSQKVRDELELTASDKAVAKYVERNPAFADVLGNFDKNIFYAYLSQMRISETELAHRLRKELAMSHLNNTIAQLGYNPTVLAEAIYKYKNEKRSVVVGTIQPENVKIKTKPSEEELKEYYEAYGEQFILPEYRTVNIVQIMPDKMADKVVIGDAELNTLYEQRKGEFTTPETRQMDQMMFASKELADSAMKGLTADNFRDVAKNKAGQTDEQTDFGWVKKDDIMAELAEVVFGMQKGKIAGPIETTSGWHIVLLRDIKAGEKPSEAQIKANLKKQLALDGAYAKTEEVVRQLEDALGQGDTLETATKSVGLTVQNLGTFDMTGTKQDGTQIASDMQSADLLQTVFLSDVNEPTSVIEHNNGYVVAEVTDIIESKPQEFEKAKPELEKMWLVQQQKDALPQMADEILKRVQDGAELQAQGTISGFKAVYENDVTREDVKDLWPQVVDTLFNQKIGNQQAVVTSVPNGRVVSVVLNVTPADPAKDEVGVGVVKQNLKTQTGEGMVHEVMNAYTDKIGVHVNERVINDAFASYQTQE